MFQPPCSVTFSTEGRKKKRNVESETCRKGRGHEDKGRKTRKHTRKDDTKKCRIRK